MIIYLFNIFLNKEKNLIEIILNFFSIFSVLFFFFHFIWGINYYRIPLHKKLNIKTDYNIDQLSKTLKILVKKSNDLHSKLTNHDTIPVYVPYDLKTVKKIIERDYKFYDYSKKIKPRIKNSLISEVISYMGFSGYINPFTLEAQINKNIPKLNYITTASHEMAHQLGITNESEANFISFVSSINNNDPFIKYAGYIFALKYCYNDLYNKNKTKAQEIFSKLNLGIIKNFKEDTSYWKNYKNPIEPYIKKVYGAFLRNKGQPKGLKTYNQLVKYVVSYFEPKKIINTNY
tara:strand:+ start:1309 stop:2175 length:867 start_codon:yes stop_codon:yes gene_type:complete